MKKALFGLVTAIAVGGALLFAKGYYWQGYLGTALIAFALTAAAAILYLVPAFVAAARHHTNEVAITALCLLLGWSIVGWIGSLVWALTNSFSSVTPSSIPKRGRGLATLGVIATLTGLLVAGIGLQMFGSTDASLYRLEQASGGLWMPYFAGWIPLAIGTAILCGGFLLVRNSGLFQRT